MRFNLILVVIMLAIVGCSKSPPTQSVSSVTIADFLSSHGFTQSATDTSIYELQHVRLGDAAWQIGFSLGELKPTVSQSLHSDIRKVEVRGHWFIVRSEVKDAQGRIVRDSLNSPDAICTISTSQHQVSPDNEVIKH